MSPDPHYSFEHGIDHSGHGGIAPILAIGHKVTAQDFVERDLSGIRGVSVSQRGLAKTAKWDDLNPGFLFDRLRGIEYLRVLFDDTVNLDALGHLPALRELVVDCPKVRGSLQGEMRHLRSAHVRWPDACTAGLNAPHIEKLVLLRPKSEDLTTVGHLTSLVELDVHYNSALHSLDGIGHFRSLKHLGIHDCSRLAEINIAQEWPGPAELLIGGCIRFANATGAQNLRNLRKLAIYRGARGPHEVQLPNVLKDRGIELDLRGVASTWI